MRQKTIYKITAILAFLVLVVLPIIYIYGSAFNLQRYLWVLKDRRQQEIFCRTIELGLGTAALSLVLGTITAVLFEYTDIPLKRYLRFLFIASLLIPPYLSAISYLYFFGRGGDLVEVASDKALGSMVRPKDADFFIAPLQEKYYAPMFPFLAAINPYKIESAIAVLSMSLFPLAFFMVSSGLRNINSSIEESSLLIHPGWKTILKTSLPMVTPHMAAAGVIVAVFAVSDMGVTSAFRINTLAFEIFNHFIAFFDYRQAIGLSVPLVALITTLLAALYLLQKDKAVFSMPQARKRIVIPLSPCQKAASTAFVFLLLFFSSIMPSAILLHQSRMGFIEAIGKSGASIPNTVFLAFSAATLMTAVGFLCAYFFREKSGFWFLAPLAVPSAALGIGMIGLWNNQATEFIYQSFLILLIGYVSRFLPLACFMILPFIRQLPKSIEETASLTGASFTKTIKDLVAPALSKGLAAAWLFSFALTLRELDLSVMLTPPGFQTLTNRIYTLYHYGDLESTGALSIILIILVTLPLFIASKIFRDKEDD